MPARAARFLGRRRLALAVAVTVTLGAVSVDVVPSGATAWPVETTPISYGWRHGLAVRFDGTVVGWGNNRWGQINPTPVGGVPVTGGEWPDLPPVTVPGLADIVSVSAGRDFSLALAADGRVWAWGLNQHGQLGLGHNQPATTPQRVPGLGGIMTVDAGPDHTVAVASDGKVWVWGDNDSGQLGIGAGLGDQWSPVTVPDLPPVVTAVAGGYHLDMLRVLNEPDSWIPDSYSLAVDRDGKVWAWGNNEFGQLGDGTTVQRLSPVQVTGLSDVKGVAAGTSHSLAVRSDGTVWGWGFNGGLLGDGTTTGRLTPVKAVHLSDARQLVATERYSVAVQGDGSVWTWGMSAYGDGSSLTPRTEPAKAAIAGVTAITAGTNITGSEGSPAYAVRTDGTGWRWSGKGPTGLPVPVPGLVGLAEPRPAPCSGAGSTATVTIDEAIAGYATGIGIAVVDGIVDTVNPLGEAVKEVRATLEVSLRGDPPEQFTLILPADSHPHDGLPPIREGSPYLVFLRAMEDPGTYAHPPMALAFDRPGGSLGIVPAGETTTCTAPPPPNYVTTTTTTTTTTPSGPPAPPEMPPPPSGPITAENCKAPGFGASGFNSFYPTPPSVTWTYHISNAVPVGFRDNIRAAIARWASVGSGFTAIDGGQTGNNAYDATDGVAVISWRDFHAETSLEDYAAGQGRPDANGYPGDVVLNSDPRFADGSQLYWSDVRPADDATARRSIDVENVTLHEVGHVVGLDHQADPQAVMCGMAPPWSDNPSRTLGLGDQAGVRNQRPGSIVQGYFLVDEQGRVVNLGGQGSHTPSTHFYGDMRRQPLNQPAIDLTITPSKRGYWILARDGGIFTFGDAGFYGSTGGMELNQPVVAMATTPSGQGYWLVASDGGIFTFGDAGFYGSTGDLQLNKPVVGMAATASGQGYWLVASDGGIFTFGDAAFHGSTGSMQLNQPIVGMAATPNGGGYWLAAADGGIFTFGNAAFAGSAPYGNDARNISAVPGTYNQYAISRRSGMVQTFGFPFLGYLADGRALAAVEVVTR